MIKPVQWFHIHQKAEICMNALNLKLSYFVTKAYFNNREVERNMQLQNLRSSSYIKVFYFGFCNRWPVRCTIVGYLFMFLRGWKTLKYSNAMFAMKILTSMVQNYTTLHIHEIGFFSRGGASSFFQGGWFFLRGGVVRGNFQGGWYYVPGGVVQNFFKEIMYLKIVGFLIYMKVKIFGGKLYLYLGIFTTFQLDIQFG